MPAVRAYYEVIHRLPHARAFADWAFIGDLPAGPRQVGFDWAPFAETFVVVVEPTVQSALTARRTAHIARLRRGASAVFVANKITSSADRGRIESALGEPLLGAVPADPAVATAERLGVAPIDHAPETPAVRAIEELASRLASGTLADQVRSTA